jgi:uncharacterized protein (TIGR02996 family)
VIVGKSGPMVGPRGFRGVTGMDDEAFLRRIAEAPGDEALRRIYGDWLEEQGDPRSEFLRAEDRLRSAPPGDPGRRTMGRALRQIRASMDPAWLAKVETAPPVPGWVPSGALRPPRSGVVDWYEWASQSHFEFVVLAVMAPLEAIVRELIEHRMETDPDSAMASGRWDRDVRVRRGRDGDTVSPTIPFVQLKGHAWTVAVYDTFNLTMLTYNSAQLDAATLSDRLGTLALEFSSEDTSSATGYHLFDCGEFIEFAEWVGREGLYASRRRPEVPWPELPPEYPDDLFRSLGLYLPGFYSGEWRDGPCLKYGGPDASEVERADLLDLRPTFGKSSWGDGENLIEPIKPGHSFGQPDESWDGGESDDEDIPF